MSGQWTIFVVTRPAASTASLRRHEWFKVSGKVSIHMHHETIHIRHHVDRVMSPTSFDFDNCPNMSIENAQPIGDEFEWSLTFKLFDFLDRLLCSTCGVLLVIGRSRSSLMLVLLITQASQAVLDFSSRAESCNLRAERTPLCAAMAERFSSSCSGYRFIEFHISP